MNKFLIPHGALLYATKIIECFFHTDLFEGLKQSHAPAVARKVLLSITSWHPQHNWDKTHHLSQAQDQRQESLGL
jgi:hypothetical protein